jgi:DNA gyrase subunit A
MSGERVVELLRLQKTDEGVGVGLLSSDGQVKRIEISDLHALSGRAKSILRPKEGVRLKGAVICRNGEDLVIASSTGRVLRVGVNERNIPIMSRSEQGPCLMKLLPGEEVIGWTAARASLDIVLVSRHSRARRVEITSLRQSTKGSLGEMALKFQRQDDDLIAVAPADVKIHAGILSDGRNARPGKADLDGVGEGLLPGNWDIEGGNIMSELIGLKEES